MKHEMQTAFQPKERSVIGNFCTRAMTVRTLANVLHAPVAHVAAELYPSDKALLQFITRATSAPATTFTTGWAAELVAKILADTVAALGAASGAADVLAYALVLDWDGFGVISAPGFVASASNSGFVKEGDPIPVRQLTAGAASLNPYKLATIAALTREMIESSNAEALISDCLIRSTGLALDAAFFDNNAAVANTRPAGIRNGISITAASSNTDPFAAVAEDVSSLLNAVGAVGGNGPFVIVGNAGRVGSLNLRFVTQSSAVGAKSQLITVTSSAVGNDLIAIAPKGIVAALSPDPEIETSNASALVMQDTSPATPGTTGPERSLYQTESIAIKCRWPVSWALRDSRAVAWTTPSWK
jgi:Phage capsid family